MKVIEFSSSNTSIIICVMSRSLWGKSSVRLRTDATQQLVKRIQISCRVFVSFLTFCLGLKTGSVFIPPPPHTPSRRLGAGCELSRLDYIKGAESCGRHLSFQPTSTEIQSLNKKMAFVKVCRNTFHYSFEVFEDV